MTDIAHVYDRLGALDANVATLAHESERARARDEKIFSALEELKVGQATALAQQFSTTAQHVVFSARLTDVEEGVKDYRRVKTRGAALAFALTTVAGFVGYAADHIKGWIK